MSNLVHEEIMQIACDDICRYRKDITQEELEVICESCPLDKKLKEVLESTNDKRRTTGRSDISGQEIFEGDIIESHLGDKILDLNMVIKYGTYQAYCPVDQAYMDSIGFFVSAPGLPDMPVGPLEDYAKVIGNIVENPELISE